MVVPTQYYQHLYVHEPQGESVQDDTGNWVKRSAEWRYVGLCREETNGKGSTIATADGQVLVFGSLIQLPVGTPRIAEGHSVIVMRSQVSAEGITEQSIADGLISGEVVAKGTCMKYDYGRLHCRLWI